MGDDRRGLVLRYYAPAVFFAVMIFAVSSLPGPRISSFHFNPGDKVAHFIEFGIFGVLLYRAFKGAAHVKYPFLVAILTGLFYAAFDEIHQIFVPGRCSDVTDFAADAAGMVFFGSVFILMTRIRKSPRP